MRESRGMSASCPPSPRTSSSGCAAINTIGPVAEEANGFPVAMQGSHIDIGLPGAHADGFPASSEPGVDQCADVLVGRAARAPELMQLVEHPSGHSEGHPDPTAVCIA